MISPSGRAEAAAVKTQRNTTAGDRAKAQTPSNADELLKRLGLLGKRNGIYTERQLERKIRQERERWPEADEFSVSDEVRRYLLERQVEDLIIVSNLTPMQEIAFRLYAQGLGLRSIQATLGIKHQVIAAHLRRGLRKVRAAYKQGRYAGWYEVYLSEVNRPVYRRACSRRNGAGAG